VKTRSYVPQAGDIVRLNFTPQAGREQAGHRPALVLSPAVYNDKTSLMICCPLTAQIKNYPFEVLIDGSPPSVALGDRVKSVDWRVRKAQRKGKVAADELADVRAKIRALIGS
jgi:mRNA interferase MazF